MEVSVLTSLHAISVRMILISCGATVFKCYPNRVFLNITL